MTQSERDILDILNRDLKPWEFSGDEPMVVDLFAVVNRVAAERDALSATIRAALVKLVGASTREELELMEGMIRGMPAPAEDKAASIDAIHALIETCSHG